MHREGAREGPMSLAYRRILLKMSGEVLAGEGDYGLSGVRLGVLADEVAAVHRAGVQVGLVVGGGNIFRGLRGSRDGIDRVTGDHMGMLATIINSLAMRDALERRQVPAVVLSALRIDAVAEAYSRRTAVAALETGSVVVFAAGTGNPFFTTDTAGVLRAVEIGADVILKGTKVDGVYDADPRSTPNASRFDTLTYDEVLRRDLKVMDATAISLSRDNGLPIVVFDVNRQGDLLRIVQGERLGTLVGKG
jgi:uridylate kinase